jgi:hypothetical protein
MDMICKMLLGFWMILPIMLVNISLILSMLISLDVIHHSVNVNTQHDWRLKSLVLRATLGAAFLTTMTLCIMWRTLIQIQNYHKA